MNIELRRIGLRSVQREQIESNSSFFRAVAKFFNVKSKRKEKELGLNIPLASGQEATKTVVLFKNTENTLDLDGAISTQKDPLITRQCFQHLGTKFVQHLIDPNRSVSLL